VHLKAKSREALLSGYWVEEDVGCLSKKRYTDGHCWRGCAKRGTAVDSLKRINDYFRRWERGGNYESIMDGDCPSPSRVEARPTSRL